MATGAYQAKVMIGDVGNNNGLFSTFSPERCRMLICYILTAVMLIGLENFKDPICCVDLSEMGRPAIDTVSLFYPT